MLYRVAAMWHIIVGGIIIFMNGRRWCIACREDTLLLVAGGISLIIGIAGLVAGARGTAAPARAS